MVADFDDLTDQAHTALDQIAKGNPNGYKELYSRQEDITIGNPFGGFGRGVEAVYEQLERAASHYRDGETIAFEMVPQSVVPRWPTPSRSSASGRRSVAKPRPATSRFG
jgi:hypothetical protein